MIRGICLERIFCKAMLFLLNYKIWWASIFVFCDEICQVPSSLEVEGVKSSGSVVGKQREVLGG